MINSWHKWECRYSSICDCNEDCPLQLQIVTVIKQGDLWLPRLIIFTAALLDVIVKWPCRSLSGVQVAFAVREALEGVARPPKVSPILWVTLFLPLGVPPNLGLASHPTGFYNLLLSHLHHQSLTYFWKNPELALGKEGRQLCPLASLQVGRNNFVPKPYGCIWQWVPFSKQPQLITATAKMAPGMSNAI